ncbi:MAG: phage integrase family protein [Myxococcales bacterium]|nr:phage integrase family protein [Myxococcales bacterium]MCB9576009.1 phage integrase family protein [Polyangiaceae bacterium]
MTHRKTWLVTPDKFLTADHVQRLREHLELRRRRGRGSGDRKAVRDAAIIEVLLSTGLRVSEVCDLVVGDIFLDTGHVLVRRGKGNRARLVAIPKTLAEYLDEFVLWTSKVRKEVDADGPLFVSQRGAGLSRSGVHRIWKAALEAAGLPTTWGVHATRHSYATELYRRTRDLRLTQRQLGHSSPIVTQVYASLVDEDVRRGVEKVWS